MQSVALGSSGLGTPPLIKSKSLASSDSRDYLSLRCGRPVAFAVTVFLSLVPLSKGILAAEKLALDDRENLEEPNITDGTSQQDSRGADAKNGAEQKNEEKTSAQETKEEEHKPADPDTGKSTLSPETLGLLPNPFESRGIKFSATYIGETLGNPTGGARQGVVYEGRLNLAADFDLKKLLDWPGASVHANMFQIHGRSLSREYIGNLMAVSSIEALPSTRLYELWLEQKFVGDKFSIRAGQFAADTEFITSKYTDVFINSTYGWPTITVLDLPSGGPSPPLAAVGARLKLDINENITALTAIFDGDAAPSGPDDPQTRNRHGVNFRISDPPFVINELQYGYNQQRKAKGLPGTVKFGGWYHAGLFDDQRFTADGLSIADPSGSGTPARLRSNFGLYGVFEQKLFRFSDEKEERGVGAFARISGSPTDRNLIDLYADSGVNFAGSFAQRPQDKIGIAFALAHVSYRARDLDRDYTFFVSSRWPIRNYESLITIGYLAEITQGWTVLPSFQYVIHPGGGWVNITGSAIPKRANNAVVLGLRTVLRW